MIMRLTVLMHFVMCWALRRPPYAWHLVTSSNGTAVMRRLLSVRDGWEYRDLTPFEVDKFVRLKKSK